MGLMEVIAAALKIVGQLLDLHAKNQLTQAQLDAAIGLLHAVPPPAKGGSNP